MLQDLVTTLLPHLPYLAAIIIGGLAGNAIADRRIKLSPLVYILLAFVFVVSLCSQSYFLEHEMRVLLLIANALTGGSLVFALTSGGDFAEPKATARVPVKK